MTTTRRLPDTPGTMRAPRNQWYVVAFSDEVGRHLLPRRVLGDRLVLYRTEAGTAVALTDRCAHRAMALSHGKLVGDAIQCFYHGIEYDPTGQCVRVPSQDAIPAPLRVGAYPVVERRRWIWAWMGDPAQADPSSIPDHSEFGLEDVPGIVTGRPFLMEIAGNYQLLQENLLDQSHLSFLHAGMFDSGVIAGVPPTIEHDGNRVRVTREAIEIVEGAFAAIFGIEPGSRVHRILRSESWAPNMNVVTNIFTFPDDPGRPARYVYLPFPVTPATDRSCYHFGAQYRNYGPPMTPAEGERSHAVLLTDKLAIESVQQSYDELGPDTPDCSVRADQAALRYRRIVVEMLAAEVA